MSKKCIRCSIPKDLSDFYKSSKSKDGYRNICKKCYNKNGKEYQRSHSDLYNKASKNHRETFIGRYIVWRSKAKKRNIPFELKLEDLEILPRVCYYTGMFLTCACNQCNTISLDRLDSSKGYTKNNVVFCCSWVNVMKSDLSYEQFMLGCRIILDHHDRKNNHS